MEDQISQVVAEKLLSALERPLAPSTPREVVRPRLPGKALAVIGMRRAGKTTYLHQVRQELIAAGRSPERLVYFNFEDERLADLQAKDLGVVTDTCRVAASNFNSERDKALPWPLPRYRRDGRRRRTARATARPEGVPALRSIGR